MKPAPQTYRCGVCRRFCVKRIKPKSCPSCGSKNISHILRKIA